MDWIRKKYFLFYATAGVCLGLFASGCGQEPAQKESAALESTVPDTSAPETAAERGPGEKDDETVSVWKDNNADVYYAAVKTEITLQEPEGLTGRSGNFFLAGGVGGYFDKWFSDDADKRKTWVYLAGPDGSYDVQELDAHDYGAPGMGLVMGGGAPGSGYCLSAYGFKSADEEKKVQILLLDEEMRLTGSLEQPGTGYFDLQRDRFGNIAFRFEPEDENLPPVYKVVNADGETLWEKQYAVEDYRQVNWIVLPDGSLGLYTLTKSGEGGKAGESSLLCPDLANGGERLIAKTDAKNDLLFLGLFDEGETLLYADKQGIYRSTLEFENAELLYRWSSHGFSIEGIQELMALPEGGIACICSDSQKDFYLYLKPCGDAAEEIIEIPFVVPEWNQNMYQNAVAEFNKTYPQYILTMTEYPDETALLTELNAGSGPVLLDTAALSFEEHQTLWEDLDDRLSQAGLSDALLDKVMAAGQIEGEQYGIVIGWHMYTFASASCGMDGWDQKEFLDYVAAHPELALIHREQDPVEFVEEFFVQDLKNSIFADWEEGRADLDSPEFLQVLELARKYASERDVPATRSEAIAMMREGRCLGEAVYLLAEESIAYYDAMLGENINYIGFPGKDGSRHYILPNQILTIRASASEEQKQGAFLFLEFLLSREAQEKMADGADVFSVRKDVFESRLADVESEVKYQVDGEELMIKVDREAVKETLLALYEESVPYPALPGDLADVFAEELSGFFQGGQSAEQAAKILQNRVQLYLNEQ